MASEAGFNWQCTAGHPARSIFNAQTIEQLKEELTQGHVTLYCTECRLSYSFGSEMVPNLQKWIAHVERDGPLA